MVHVGGVYRQLLILNMHDHIHPSLVAAALKACVQPLVNDHLCELTSDNACTKRENVGVVMHSGKFCGVRLAADTCADAFYLVGS